MGAFGYEKDKRTMTKKRVKRRRKARSMNLEKAKNMNRGRQ